jgi:hypothetical protein
MTFHVFVFFLLSFLLLTLAWLGRLCLLHHHRPHWQEGAVHPVVGRLLKLRNPLDCPDCRLCCVHSSVVEPAHAPVRPCCEMKSRRGAHHPGRHRGLRLSQSAVRVLRNHRCSPPCNGWRWQARPGRAHPDLSLSGMPDHLQCSTPHSVVSFENPFTPGRHGSGCARLWARPIRGRAGFRLPTSHHHCVAHSCRGTRTDFARTLLLPSLAPHEAVG